MFGEMEYPDPAQPLSDGSNRGRVPDTPERARPRWGRRMDSPRGAHHVRFWGSPDSVSFQMFNTVPVAWRTRRDRSSAFTGQSNELFLIRIGTKSD